METEAWQLGWYCGGTDEGDDAWADHGVRAKQCVDAAEIQMEAQVNGLTDGQHDGGSAGRWCRASACKQNRVSARWWIARGEQGVIAQRSRALWWWWISKAAQCGAVPHQGVDAE